MTRPRPLGTREAVALVRRARELLGGESMRPYGGVPAATHDEVVTFARLRPDGASRQRPVPVDRQLFCGRDDAGCPQGEILFWVDGAGEVSEIELVWYSNDLPATWPVASDLWVSTP